MHKWSLHFLTERYLYGSYMRRCPCSSTRLDRGSNSEQPSALLLFGVLFSRPRPINRALDTYISLYVSLPLRSYVLVVITKINGNGSTRYTYSYLFFSACCETAGVACNFLAPWAKPDTERALIAPACCCALAAGPSGHSSSKLRESWCDDCAGAP